MKAQFFPGPTDSSLLISGDAVEIARLVRVLATMHEAHMLNIEIDRV